MRLFVRLDGQQIGLAQVGGGRLYFDEPTSLRAGAAEVIIEIDGEAQVTPVMIAGTSEPLRIIEFTPVE